MFTNYNWILSKLISSLQSVCSGFQQTNMRGEENALAGSQDKSVFGGEPREIVGDNLYLGGCLQNQSRMMNSQRNRCCYLSMKDHSLLNIIECVVESKNGRSFSRASDEEDCGKHKIADVERLGGKHEPGCYYLWYCFDWWHFISDSCLVCKRPNTTRKLDIHAFVEAIW